VVNRAVVYGALAFLITLLYGVVVIAPAVFIFGIGAGELLLPLIATALIALAMQPLRQRLQHFANSVVYGKRATPYEAMADFSHRISDALSLEEVLPRMAEAAAGGVGAERAQVKVFLPAGGELRSDWPVTSDGASFDQTISVEHQGELVGEISVAKPPRDPVTPAEEALLRDLAAQAGLALHNVRLTQELKSRLDQISEQAQELRASRQRIVEAQDAERRRLERNIHDGAQQQLVSMSVKLRMAKQMMGSDGAKAQDLLDSLMVDTQETVETLRDLARGVFPPLLVERGVEQAISAHIGKLGLDANMHVGEGFASTRFDPSIEAAIYFCCLEAMQNASKHAAGSEVNVRLVASDGYVEFSVADRGPGFDPSGDGGGSGIQNMRDRVEALGGSLRISSKPGKGTTVSGRIPLA
ncbi:MAG: sensor histidine kinase, partial [Actinomycetota bacterium]